jgi:hypothetical protein
MQQRKAGGGLGLASPLYGARYPQTVIQLRHPNRGVDKGWPLKS